jgi:type IV pilus assembly protein PilX
MSASMSVSGDLKRRAQHGMVLITTLLLLVVVTLLALGMFRGMGLEERIAGNTMEKQRATQSAVSAEQYAEQWLQSNVAGIAPVTCGVGGAATASGSMICLNTLAQTDAAGQATTVPWATTGGNMGFTYNPDGLEQVSASGGVNTYVQLPTFYIAYLDKDLTDPNGFDYQIDAWSYAGAASTVAVVESVYKVHYKVLPPPL